MPVPNPRLIYEVVRHHPDLPISTSYTLVGMAGDALYLFGALDIPQAHVLGVSTGGMIA